MLRRRLAAEVVNKWLDTQFCEGKNDDTDRLATSLFSLRVCAALRDVDT